jgi:hypothetical protein
VGMYRQRRPLHEPQTTSSGPITGTAHVDGDQASTKKIASLGYRLPDDLIQPCGENRRVQEGACSRCAAANFESRTPHLADTNALQQAADREPEKRLLHEFSWKAVHDVFLLS